jgi:glycosyltransferase involved in cell wall biosynthesis
MNDFGDLIQIVIPCFNGEEYLAETLNSIKHQTYHNFDCLLIDDCSDDKSFEIYQHFAKNDTRFRVLQNSENQGESYSVNKGWANRRGSLISILSCDDPQPSDWLEEMHKFYKSNSEKNSIVFYPNRKTIDSLGKTLTRDYLLDWNQRTINNDFICIPSVGAIIDANKLPSDFVPRLNHVDYPSDLIQYLNISRFGEGLRHPTFFCNWRLHSQNKSSLDRTVLAECLEAGICAYFNSLNTEMNNYQIVSLTSQCHRLKTYGLTHRWISWFVWYNKFRNNHRESFIKAHYFMLIVLLRYFLRRFYRLVNSRKTNLRRG